MKTIIIDNVEYIIEYKETKIGDKVVDLNSNIIYEASIADADDLNWVIKNESKV